MSIQILKTFFNIPSLFRILNGCNEKIDKPG